MLAGAGALPLSACLPLLCSPLLLSSRSLPLAPSPLAPSPPHTHTGRSSVPIPREPAQSSMADLLCTPPWRPILTPPSFPCVRRRGVEGGGGARCLFPKRGNPGSLSPTLLCLLPQSPACRMFPGMWVQL